MAISNTDCMLAIGTRFDDRLTGGVDSFAPDAEVIHVDIDPAEISKNVYADYPLIGDAREVLRQLFDAMPRAPDADEWRDQCQEWKSEYPMDYDTPDDEPLKPQYVVEQFSEMTPDDTIVCTGVGQHQMWASQFWEYTEPRTWVSSHGSTMGYGVPAAIGAKLAAPDQEVVCFDGDGSFLMTVQGLSVAVREQLDITYVVLNNEAVGMVRQWQDGFYEAAGWPPSTRGFRSSTSSPRPSAHAGSRSNPTRTSRKRYRKHATTTARASSTPHRPRGERLPDGPKRR